jgi:predicted acetyltransferase
VLGARRELRLRPFEPADELAARAAHAELREQDGFPFLLLDREDEPWGGFLARCAAEHRGDALPPGRVPATFLAAVVADELVGRVSIRHALNEYLARVGGHIGYAIRPAHRRRGHGTEVLRQALIVARAEGVADVLVTCDDDNLGSARIIESCGGELESLVQDPDGVKRRYWIR